MTFKIDPRGAEEQEPLLEAVKRGEMTPEEADYASIEMGYGPFAFEPKTANYPVHEMRVWTIVMTAAWILWRDYDAVTYFHNPYRDRFTYWLEHTGRPPLPAPSLSGRSTPRTRPNAELKKLRPATFSDLGTAYRYNRDIAQNDPAFQCKDDVEARGVLWEELITGRIIATGIDSESKAYVQIDPFHWRYLSLVSTSSSDVAPHKGIKMPSYENVELRRQEVEQIWQPLGEPEIDGRSNNAISNETSEKLSPLRKEIRRAISALWPNGEIPSSPGVREKAIIDRLASDKKTSVSNKTIKNYFKDFPPDA